MDVQALIAYNTSGVSDPILDNVDIAAAFCIFMMIVFTLVCGCKRMSTFPNRADETLGNYLLASPPEYYEKEEDGPGSSV